MLNIYEAKPQYVLLNTLLKDELENIIYTNNVNIIIDFKQVIRKIFRGSYSIESLDKIYLKSQIEAISSDIIGIISHYRNYFHKYSKYTTFYFIYSESECEIIKNIYPDYKKDFYDKYLHTNEENKVKQYLMKKVMNVCKTVFSFLPNVYYINSSKYDELVYIKHIIQTANEYDINLVLSNDENMLQVIDNHSFVLDIKGNKTKIYKLNTAISNLLESPTKVSPKLIPLILAITGHEKYSLPKTKPTGFNKTVVMLENMINNGLLTNVYHVKFPLKKDDLKSGIELLVKSNIETIKNNYGILNVDELLNTYRIDIIADMNIPKTKITIGEYNDLNVKIFNTFPLQLDMLIKGEEL